MWEWTADYWTVTHEKPRKGAPPRQDPQVTAPHHPLQPLTTPHHPSQARSAGVDFRLEDFRRISAETPFISDLKPSGKYVMEDLHYAGGTPGVLKYMLAEGYLHGDCMTVTGMAVC